MTSINGTVIERFTINNKTTICEGYKEKCTCYGTLSTISTYPSQYECSGFNKCVEHEIEINNCRNLS